VDKSNRTYTGMAEINGAELYYEVAGEGDPLLLLHAGVADSRMWDDQIAVFAHHFQAIRYDLRGFGHSVVPSRPFAHHEDVASLMRFLGIARANVIGASFGGSVAVDFTLEYPDMVKALILCAPIISGYEPSSKEMRQFFEQEDEALERDELDVATELNLRMWVDGPQRTPDQVDPMVRERVREMQLHAFSVLAPEGAERLELSPPAITRLAEIKVPTLIIVGELDVPEFLKISEMVGADIKGARRIVVPGVAHMPTMEKPGLFNQLVLEFLGDA
jgi:3-oxoadipate enol-lactonase